MSGETKDPIWKRYRRAYDSWERRWMRFRRGWRRFKRHRVGVLGLGILVLLLFIGILAPVLAPHTLSWQAPSSLDKGGAESLKDLAKTQIRHPDPPKFGDPYFAPLGTDHKGRGILTQLIYGARITLYIGVTAAFLSSMVGVPLGLISGFYGDTLIDEGIQRLVDIVYSLPFLPVVIVFVTVFGVSTTNIIVAIALKSWLNNSIVIRGETLSLKESPYIDAAKVAGASDTRIIFRHILPNVLPLAFVFVARDAAFAIIAQASLAFLGLADITNISWGVMLQWVQVTGHVFDAPWWMVPPGLLITAVAASFYFVGYSMEDVTNPHMEGKAPSSRSISLGLINYREGALFFGVILGIIVFALGLAVFIAAVSMTTSPPPPYFENSSQRLLAIAIGVATMVVSGAAMRGLGRLADL